MDAIQTRLAVTSPSETSSSTKTDPVAGKPVSVPAVGSRLAGVEYGGISSRPITQTNRASYESIRAELEESAKNANDRLALYNQKLDIAIDGATGAIVVKVSDADTGETLRQIPSEDALRIMRNIDSLTGILVDHKE